MIVLGLLEIALQIAVAHMNQVGVDVGRSDARSQHSAGAFQIFPQQAEAHLLCIDSVKSGRHSVFLEKRLAQVDIKGCRIGLLQRNEAIGQI